MSEPRVTPQTGVYAGREFAHAKCLDDIIVSAEFERIAFCFPRSVSRGPIRCMSGLPPKAAK